MAAQRLPYSDSEAQTSARIAAWVVRSSGHICLRKTIIVKALKAIDASPKLRSKKDLIEIFIAGANHIENVQSEWKIYINQKKDEELQKIIDDEKLKPEETWKFIDEAFQTGEIKTSGTDISEILPPMSPFNKKRGEKKQTVIEKLKAFFERFFGIC